MPYSYREKAAVAALQWAVGPEPFLLSADPWRVVLSTDHPNGGTFLSYPVDPAADGSNYRDEKLKSINLRLLAGSALLDGLTREYTLNEIAIITRAAPPGCLAWGPRATWVPGRTPM